MTMVRCTQCRTVYDLGKVTVIARYADCSVWKCPGCKITVDDRPVGWGAHHYTELNTEQPRRFSGYDVFCHSCGQSWAEEDRAVRYVYGDGVWECSEESACFDRRAMRQLHQEVTGDGAR